VCKQHGAAVSISWRGSDAAGCFSCCPKFSLENFNAGLPCGVHKCLGTTCDHRISSMVFLDRSAVRQAPAGARTLFVASSLFAHPVVNEFDIWSFTMLSAVESYLNNTDLFSLQAVGPYGDPLPSL
jgi:hypothetical protein